MSVPAKFERYEIFRILLPGFYALSAFLLTLFSFFPIRTWVLQIIQSNAFLLILIFGGIYIGLFLYNYDYPKRTRFYKEEIEPNLPSTYLKTILCDECEEQCDKMIRNVEGAKPFYFYLLYKFFDLSSQGVIHYFGSVYRVYTNIRAITGLLGWFEIILAFINLLIFLFFIENTFNVIIINTVGPFCLGILFIYLWKWLYKYAKGDSYMRQITEFQRKYLEFEKERIKEKVCVRT